MRREWPARRRGQHRQVAVAEGPTAPVAVLGGSDRGRVGMDFALVAAERLAGEFADRPKTDIIRVVNIGNPGRATWTVHWTLP